MSETTSPAVVEDLLQQVREHLAFDWGKRQTVADVGRSIVKKLSEHPTTRDVAWTFDADEEGAKLTVFPEVLRGLDLKFKDATARGEHVVAVTVVGVDLEGRGPSLFQALAALARHVAVVFEP